MHPVSRKMTKISVSHVRAGRAREHLRILGAAQLKYRQTSDGSQGAQKPLSIFPSQCCRRSGGLLNLFPIPCRWMGGQSGGFNAMRL